MRKPVSGAIWGIILGIAVAVVVQQQGIWPLDKLTVFLLPGLLGLIGVLITSIGRPGATAPMVVMLVISLGLTAYGATGLAEMNEVGQLNGGCTVEATSAVDSTVVTDTSRMDPFDVDPQGSLSWKASSGSVFDDYPWRIYVEIGGSQVRIDEEASEDNDAGVTENSDTVANVQEYGESRGIPVSQLRGVYKVGGFASVCNGFGFVNITSGPLESLISKVAAAIALLALAMLIRTFMSSRPPVAPLSSNGGGEPAGAVPPEPGPSQGSQSADSPAYEPGTLSGENPVDQGAGGSDESPTGNEGDPYRSIATDIAAGAALSGYVTPDMERLADLESEDLDDIAEALVEGRPDQEPPPPPAEGPPPPPAEGPPPPPAEGTPKPAPADEAEPEPEKEDPYKGLPGLED